MDRQLRSQHRARVPKQLLFTGSNHVILLHTVLPKCYAFEKIYLVKKSSNEKSNGTL